MKRILILGATSAIAIATARLWAARGDHLFLVARDAAKLGATANDLEVLGAAGVIYETADLADDAGHAALLEKALGAFEGELDIALIAYGTLSDQAASEADAATTLRELNTNFLSVASLLTELANRLERQRHGTLAVISSVAGDRGRPSNYVYGSAKGGLSLFLEGLRGRLFRSGVKVLTIKPGFVDTPMTADIKKNPLFASPEQVATDIVRAIDRGRDTLYTPFFWAFIMAIIRLIPGALFKRLKL